jgi:UPF0271 protein
MQIDLNCDMGESFGRYTLGHDAEAMPLVSSANIACGFHAGDPVVMGHTVRLAVENHVGVGAHPAFPDLVGFGRRNIQLSPNELRHAIIYQLGALSGFARTASATVRHVKMHGALYNMAANDESMGHVLADAILSFDESLIVFGLSGSRFVQIARDAGLTVAREAFADRAYNDDGTLVSRNQPEAVITDSAAVVERVLKMISEHKVIARTGAEVDVEIDTICVHGDTPGAVDHITHIYAALRQAGIDIVPVHEKRHL